MVNKISNRIGRDKSTKEHYEAIKQRVGILNKANNKDIFLLALAFGFDKKRRVKIGSMERFINKENFGGILPSILDSIAISESKEGIEIISKEYDEIYHIAEEYANAGIDQLNDIYIGNQDEFIEILRSDIIEKSKEYDILNVINQLDI